MITMGEYIKKKKDMNFQSVDALQQVVNVVNEASAALNDKSRTIRESSIPEVLGGALGAGIGGVGSFAALYGCFLQALFEESCKIKMANFATPKWRKLQRLAGAA